MRKTRMKKQKEMVLGDNDEETQRVPVEESMGNTFPNIVFLVVYHLSLPFLYKKHLDTLLTSNLPI